MRRDDVILTIALCASLLVHGLLTIALVWTYADGRIYLPGDQRQFAAAGVDPDSEFGKVNGTGDAPHTVALDRELLGRQAPSVQAFLSRDPAGPGKIGVEPTMNVLPEGEEGDGMRRGISSQAPLEATRAVVMEQPAQEPAVVGTVSKLADLAPPLAQMKKPATQPFQARTAIASASVAQQGGVGGKPGLNAPAADPAPMSDSESDPFRQKATVEVSAGKVEARLGREVKTVRPKLSYVAEMELYTTQSRSMRVRLHLDSAGKVTKLDIVRSSGSETADQETKVALYKWEFDPRPTRVPDWVEFDLIWR